VGEEERKGGMMIVYKADVMLRREGVWIVHRCFSAVCVDDLAFMVQREREYLGMDRTRVRNAARVTYQYINLGPFGGGDSEIEREPVEIGG
jgi:hypothetical protein